jgi:plasmid stabilization system protein ParE
MQKYNAIVTIEAQNDIKLLVNFMNGLNGEYSAIKFNNNVNKAINSLTINPEINKYFDDEFIDQNVRRIIVLGYKVGIVYRIDNDQLDVIAIMAYHDRSDNTIYKNIIKQRIDRLDNK